MSRLPLPIRGFAVLVLALGLSACSDDSGPSGPGSYTVVVQHPSVPAGGVVMELRGEGLLGVESNGGSRVFSAPLADGSGLRIVAVNPGEAPLSFRVLVADLALAPPRGDVIVATLLDNSLSAQASTYRVRVSRD
jgi:hypothetical protein